MCVSLCLSVKMAYIGGACEKERMIGCVCVSACVSDCVCVCVCVCV